MPDLPDTRSDLEKLANLAPSALDFPVVGMGVSAGGLDSLLRFFENLPANNGMAFVVMLDLSTDPAIHAAQRLQSVTKMPMLHVDGLTALQPDHVYVMALHHGLAMNEGQLRWLGDPICTEHLFWSRINNTIKFTQEGRPGDLTQKIGVRLSGGLALVQELAAAQGGRVQTESKGLDPDATFTVWLFKAYPQPQASLIKTLPTRLKGLRILLVDDMVDLLEPFAALLQQEGASTDMATSGQQALELLEATTYDLLISDIGMPYMDGYDLIRKIRKRPGLEKLKAIALSGYGRQVDTVRALQSGFDVHLSKPSTVNQICQAIAKLTSQA